MRKYLLKAQRYMAGENAVSLDIFRGNIVESSEIYGWFWPYIGSVSPNFYFYLYHASSPTLPYHINTCLKIQIYVVGVGHGVSPSFFSFSFVSNVPIYLVQN